MAKLKNSVHSRLIEDLANDSMLELQGNSKTFEHFSYALDAVDVTFQRILVPKEHFHTKMVYYSGKHAAYGMKFEVAVQPTGLASFVSRPFEGSVHDVNIFKANAQHHLSRTAKSAAERAQNATDNGIGSEVHSNNWAILADKGYQGAASIACIISPHKAVHGILTLEQQQQNQRISHDCIIVENFFGRMKNLWGAMQDTYKFGREDYGTYATWAVALTNFHIRAIPLRAEDGQFYLQYL